jgi:hypothetical protein
MVDGASVLTGWPKVDTFVNEEERDLEAALHLQLKVVLCRYFHLMQLLSRGHCVTRGIWILTTETFSWTMQPCLNPNMFEWTT